MSTSQENLYREKCQEVLQDGRLFREWLTGADLGRVNQLQEQLRSDFIRENPSFEQQREQLRVCFMSTVMVGWVMGEIFVEQKGLTPYLENILRQGETYRDYLQVLPQHVLKVMETYSESSLASLAQMHPELLNSPDSLQAANVYISYGIISGFVASALREKQKLN